MIKTLKQVLSSDKESFKVPYSVQDTIPIKRVWPDGTFQVGNKYSKTFKFSDINYSVASKDDQMAMFLDYCELLNSLEVGATTKITINNKRLNKKGFRSNLVSMKDDGLNEYRKEYNTMLMEKAMRGSGIIQEKYITVSVIKQSYEEAKTFFARIAADLSTRLARLSSKSTELEVSERMRIFHDFFRIGDEEQFRFDLSEIMKKGHSFVDSICPSSVAYKTDHMMIGEKYARVLYLREYPSYIKDSMITELCEMNRNMMLSMDIIPVQWFRMTWNSSARNQKSSWMTSLREISA